MSTEITSVPVLPQRPLSRAPIVLSWVLIVALLGIVVYGNARPGKGAPYDRFVSDQRARMFGMLVVQLKSLQKVNASAPIQERLDGLIRQMDEESVTPEDKIRAAILTGESRDTNAGLARLSSISGIENHPDAADDIRSIRTIYQDGADALPPVSKDRLIRRHGYVGRLVLAHGIPPDREPQKTLQAEALWYVLRLSVLGFGLVILMVLSLGLFIGGCVWFSRGKIGRAYSAGASSGGTFLEGFALYLILFLGLGLLLRYLGPLSLQWTWMALLILPAVYMWISLRGTTVEQLRQALGWHRGRGFLREVGAGLAGYVAGLVVIAIGCLVTVFLIRFSGVHAASPIVQELNGGPWHLLGLYAIACVFAPVMEETMFRGVLFHHMRQRWGWAASAVVVSFIFAMLHPQGWVAVPALGAIAVVLAALREWRGSLIAPVAAHACNNFAVLTLALIFLK